MTKRYKVFGDTLFCDDSGYLDYYTVLAGTFDSYEEANDFIVKSPNLSLAYTEESIEEDQGNV